MKYYQLLLIAFVFALNIGCGKEAPDSVPDEISPERLKEINDQNAKVEAEEKANIRKQR